MRRQRHTIESIRETLCTEGYKLISTEYKNTKTKIDVICPNGHEYKMRWDMWTLGVRCGQCNGNYGVNTYEDVKQSFDDEGYILLSEEYVNNSTKLDFICPEGHEHFITWANWRTGQRCGRCKGNIEVTYDEVRKSFESEGFTLVSEEYKNNHEKLDAVCDKGHKFSIKYGHWRDGIRCGSCPSKSSKPEEEIKLYIEEFYDSDIIQNEKSLVKNPITNRNLELDIYLPDINKAIEFNGDYWHSIDIVVNRDMIKKRECDRMGIDLLVIQESDWKENRSLVEEKIKNLILV